MLAFLPARGRGKGVDLSRGNRDDGRTMAPASLLCGTSCCTAAVWERMAGDYACGERILWLQSPAGGSLSEAASCRQVAGMEYAAECGACSP